MTAPPPPACGEPVLVALDANALDRDGTGRDALVERLRAGARDGRLRLFVPSGVAAEMRHPDAPAPVGAILDEVATLAGPAPASAGGRLTARQQIDRIRVRAVMRGDGRPGKHDADAAHLSEAAEAGCSHFVTRDGKILRKRAILRDALPPGLSIVTLEDFLSEWQDGG